MGRLPWLSPRSNLGPQGPDARSRKAAAMSSRQRNSLRFYFRANHLTDVLLDEALKTIAAGHPSGRSGAARALLQLGWLAAAGTDPRPIVPLLRIPRLRSIEITPALLQSLNQRGPDEDGASILPPTNSLVPTDSGTKSGLDTTGGVGLPRSPQPVSGMPPGGGGHGTHGSEVLRVLGVVNAQRASKAGRGT